MFFFSNSLFSSLLNSLLTLCLFPLKDKDEFEREGATKWEQQGFEGDEVWWSSVV